MVPCMLCFPHNTMSWPVVGAMMRSGGEAVSAPSVDLYRRLRFAPLPGPVFGGGRYAQELLNKSSLQRTTPSPPERSVQVSAELLATTQPALYELLWHSRLSRLRTANSAAEFDDQSDESETSSVCSDRSFSSYIRGGYEGHCPRKEVPSIVKHLSSIHWSDRKEGLLGLLSVLRSGRTLLPDLKKVTDMVTNMFMHPQPKWFTLFLEALEELIYVHHSDLHSWLYVLLTRIFMTTEILSIIRDSSRPAELLQAVERYITDSAQTPNIDGEAGLHRIRRMSLDRGVAKNEQGTPNNIFAILQNPNRKSEHRKQAMNELMPLTKKVSPELWENFRNVLRCLVRRCSNVLRCHLGDQVVPVKVAALRALAELLKRQPQHFYKHAELTLMKIFGTFKQPEREVCRAVEQCCMEAAAALPPDQSLRLLQTLIGKSEEQDVAIAAIKVMSRLVDVHPKRIIFDLLPQMMPVLLRAYDLGLRGLRIDEATLGFPRGMQVVTPQLVYPKCAAGKSGGSTRAHP